MEIRIPYGSTSMDCILPLGAKTLSITEPEEKISPQRFKNLLHDHLHDHGIDLNDTMVVVADKTRVCGYPTYLPLLTEVLIEEGLNEERFRFIIAYGTHPRQSDQECEKSYGPIYHHFPFIHHNCHDQEIFADCGTTSLGTPIRYRRDILNASCVITMGPICHHYFAGYGGGRKLLFPGCGERQAIFKNHSLYLDRQTQQLSRTCQPGILHNNPLATDLFGIEKKRPADLSIHGIMDSGGQLCDVVIGSGIDNFAKACSIHSNLCEVSTKTYPLILASCGGFPKDINFIQSHKAIHNASMFVEDGGTLIIYSELRDGIGSKTFLPWFENRSFAEAFRHLSHNYEGNGGTALAMMTKNMRIRIVMVTQLEKEVCDMIGVEKWNHTQVCGFIKKISTPIGYLPNASLLVRKVPD